MAAVGTHLLPNSHPKGHQLLGHLFWRLQRSIPLLGRARVAGGSQAEGVQYPVAG
jgi:hypothetical protein